MNRNIAVIVALLSVAVAAGGITFGLKANNQRLAAEKEAESLRMKMTGTNTTAPSTNSMEETNKEPLVALQDLGVDTNDVASMQAKLLAQASELERLRAELADRQNRPPRQSFQERMAQMKEEDPERYAEMVQRRTERQQQMRYDQANRLANFMNMDTSKMTPEELENHNMLVEKLSSIWNQTGEFDPEQPPNREAMRAVFETLRDVRPLMDQERTTMLKQLGGEVGLNGTDAQDFATYVQDIYDATSMGFPGRGGFGRDRGGRDGGAGEGTTGGGNTGGNSTPAGTVQ